MKKDFSKKKLMVFDLDGTLAPSKAVMHEDMSALMTKLLAKMKVAVIGGGKYDLFKTQFVAALDCPKALLHNLFLFPTSSTAFYRFDGRWRKVYAKELSLREKKKIKKAFDESFKEINYVHPKKVYGAVIEDRGTQITFSALGQEIVSVLGEKKGLRLKEEWHAAQDIRPQLMKALHKRLPEFEVRQGGLTSVDVTYKGIDKAYGIRQIEKQLHVPKKWMLFVGDAIFPGGNDYAAVRTGVDYVKVRDPNDTKRLIQSIIKQKSRL